MYLIDTIILVFLILVLVINVYLLHIVLSSTNKTYICIAIIGINLIMIYLHLYYYWHSCKIFFSGIFYISPFIVYVAKTNYIAWNFSHFKEYLGWEEYYIWIFLTIEFCVQIIIWIHTWKSVNLDPDLIWKQLKEKIPNTPLEIAIFLISILVLSIPIKWYNLVHLKYLPDVYSICIIWAFIGRISYAIFMRWYKPDTNKLLDHITIFTYYKCNLKLSIVIGILYLFKVFV